MDGRTDPQPPLLVYFSRGISAVGGIVTDTPRSLWDSVRRTCTETGFNLLTAVGDLSGQNLDSPSYHAVGPQDPSAILSWALGVNNCDSLLFTSYSPRPVISLAAPVAGATVSTIDNRAGMLQLMGHLIEHHGFRSFGFLRGPAAHPYAEARLAAFREALEQAGLPLEEYRIAPPGDWDRISGRAGAAHLLDVAGLQPGKTLDALVCASDRIAVGAMLLLQERGYLVPRHCAVTGFNNLVEAQTADPPITGVRIPLGDQAREAVRNLRRVVAGLQPLAPADHKTSAIVLQSCGCPNHHQKFLDQPVNTPCHPSGPQDGRGSGIEAVDGETLVAQLKVHFAEFDRPIPPHHASELWTSFQQSLQKEEFSAFDAAITAAVDDELDLSHNQARWQDILTLVRNAVLGGVTDREIWLRSKLLIEKARVRIGEIASRHYALNQLDQVMKAALQSQVEQELIQARTNDDVYQALATLLPRGGVPSVWIVLYPDPVKLGSGPPQIPPQARVVVAVEQGEPHDLPSGGLDFDTTTFLPPAVLDRHRSFQLVLRNLEFLKECYGYIVFELGPPDGMLYENLSLRIGAALRTLRLQNKLFETRTRLIEAEKLASLAKAVSGIAHEVNTPVGIGITGISWMAQRLVEFHSQPGPVPEFLAELRGVADLIQTNLMRAGDLMNTFKKLSGEPTGRNALDFSVRDVVESVVAAVSPRLEAAGHRLTWSCGPVQLHADPQALVQVLSQLIDNSIVHGFGGKTTGTIRLTTQVVGDALRLEYHDDGMGMDETTVAHQYEPFYHLKGGGHVGISMHQVFWLVTRDLKGDIRCESSPGSGVHYTITLPLR